MKKTISLTLCGILALFVFTGCGKSNTKQSVSIYSIIHEEETQALTELFTKKTGIPAKFLRASTGELVNRVRAEKDNPQADILLGGATAYHIQLDKDGVLESYRSPVAENLPKYALAEDGTWTGFCVLSLGIGINEDRYKQKFAGIPVPKTWDDLVNPAYKGEIVLTNPVASSTAYLFVQNQLQRLGWEKGWDYLLNLASLVGQFPDSGSAPGRLIGTGEYALCVTFLHVVNKYHSDGFKVYTVAPPQSVVDIDCISIMKNTKNLEAAQKFVDFMLSVEAQELMSSIDFTMPVNPDAKEAEGSIPVTQLDLIEYDVNKAAAQKEEVLAKWTAEVK